jgi:hypothetical protein
MKKTSTQPRSNSTPKRTTRQTADDKVGAANDSLNVNNSAAIEFLTRLLKDPETPFDTVDAIVTLATRRPVQSTVQWPPVVEGYSANIEARRPAYEQLANTVAWLLDFEYNQPGGRGLGIRYKEASYAETNKNHLMHAIRAHIMAIVDYSELTMSPAAILRFYVELRLFGDQMQEDQAEKQKMYAAYREAENQPEDETISLV